jgi:hypothetical protein
MIAFYFFYMDRRIRSQSNHLQHHTSRRPTTTTHTPIRSYSSELSRIQLPLIINNEDHEEEEQESHPSRQNKKKINMDAQMLKVNMLSITLAGVFIGLGGIVLYFTRDFISSYVRFFLPIPPIGVAAYVFVFNMFKFYNATLPSFSAIVIDVLLSTLTAALVFFVLDVLMIVIIWAIL